MMNTLGSGPRRTSDDPCEAEDAKAGDSNAHGNVGIVPNFDTDEFTTLVTNTDAVKVAGGV